MSFQMERWHAGTPHLAQDVEMLGDVLHACVHAGASVSFILPFSHVDATAFFHNKVLPAVKAGTTCLLVARESGKIVGTVQLDLDTPPNQPHRAEVKKLLVHPGARRQGIAKALMIALEDEARAAGRSLLTLDTRTGDSAEPLYRSLGYTTAGVIPRYSRRPESEELDATTLMYKELSP